MLRVENVEVYDLERSIVASGYAMGLYLDDFYERVNALKRLSITNIGNEDTIINFVKYYNKHKNELSFDEICNNVNITTPSLIEDLKLVTNEINRINRLVKASKNSSNVKCHHNFMTGIRVSFDLVYPNYISPEMQRYHWFDIVTSNSKMHRITKMDFNDCCNEYVTQESKDNMKKYIAEYNDIVNVKLSDDLDKEKHDEDVYKAFMKVLSNCPQGIELFMRVSTNYMQLQTMYFQRKNHKLKEDWGAFCNFVESLPLFNLLIKGDVDL